jgi:hypothetical protein
MPLSWGKSGMRMPGDGPSTSSPPCNRLADAPGRATTCMPTASTDRGGNRPLTFVDTNVLAYAHDASNPVKQALARAAIEQLWADGSGILSTQVLQEFYAVVTGRQRIRMPSGKAREVLALYGAWTVVQVDLVTIPAAVSSARPIRSRSGTP